MNNAVQQEPLYANLGWPLNLAQLCLLYYAQLCQSLLMVPLRYTRTGKNNMTFNRLARIHALLDIGHTRLTAEERTEMLDLMQQQCISDATRLLSPKHGIDT